MGGMTPPGWARLVVLIAILIGMLATSAPSAAAQEDGVTRDYVRLRAQTFGPLLQRRPRRRVEARDLVVAELARQLDGREAGPVEDLVRVGVADAVEQPWVGERALEGVALGQERRPKGVARRVQHRQAAAREGG